ncbi:galaxin-like [Pelmatolapia mariae]|uniref:galaxin-like n=1 Tax=Pelmatolapia mariae TaxID=158779 RepID=UPI002FE54C51
MIPFWTLGFVCLIIGLSTAHEPAVGANAASKNHCSRKDCNGTQYDIQEAACCENKLHPGSNLFCCGKEPYNPGTATCCKVQHGKILTASITQGLSEKVSKCCDLKAYNPVNEICCQSTIISKPGPMAECCGEDVFDKDKQLCCGPADNKTILV